jgi:hypothetical protein
MPPAEVMLAPPMLPPAPEFCPDGSLVLLHATSDIAAKPAKLFERGPDRRRVRL